MFTSKYTCNGHEHVLVYGHLYQTSTHFKMAGLERMKKKSSHFMFKLVEKCPSLQCTFLHPLQCKHFSQGHLKKLCTVLLIDITFYFIKCMDSQLGQSTKTFLAGIGWSRHTVTYFCLPTSFNQNIDLVRKQTNL